MCEDGYYTNVVMSGGPDRIVHDDPDPQFKTRPVGFVAHRDAPSRPTVEREPLLWEGDDA